MEGLRDRRSQPWRGGRDAARATEPFYLDLELPAGATFTQVLPLSHNAFVYVDRGGVRIGDTQVPVQRMAILLANDDGADGVVLTAAASRVLLIAARRPTGRSRSTGRP